MPALNPASVLPLYAQLADKILAQIRAGEFSVGAKIPSEHELAKRYGIGRPTVRQATEMLIRRGYLLRRRGSGTFVTERESHVDLFSLGGTLSSFSRQGFELRTRLEEAPALVTEEGDHAFAGRLAYRMQRVGSVEGEPVLVETFWFDAGVFPFFDQLDVVGRSLSEVVLARYQLEATSADQRFSVVELTAAQAQLLGLNEGTSVLLVERSLHFRAGRASVFAQMLCRTDRFRFSQHISGGAPHADLVATGPFYEGDGASQSASASNASSQVRSPS